MKPKRLIESLKIVEGLLKRKETPSAIGRLQEIIRFLEHFEQFSAGGSELQYLRHFVLNNVVGMKVQIAEMEKHCKEMEMAINTCNEITGR